ncbi:hypothetical protein BC940DRAFT_351261 [Gongronella butleri]|nr:hypothetical protein BC940DRAFT_351261 [Gongronella butleri]
MPAGAMLVVPLVVKNAKKSRKWPNPRFKSLPSYCVVRCRAPKAARCDTCQSTAGISLNTGQQTRSSWCKFKSWNGGSPSIRCIKIKTFPALKMVRAVIKREQNVRLSRLKLDNARHKLIPRWHCLETDAWTHVQRKSMADTQRLTRKWTRSMKTTQFIALGHAHRLHVQVHHTKARNSLSGNVHTRKAHKHDIFPLSSLPIDLQAMALDTKHRRAHSKVSVSMCVSPLHLIQAQQEGGAPGHLTHVNIKTPTKKLAHHGHPNTAMNPRQLDSKSRFRRNIGQQWSQTSRPSSSGQSGNMGIVRRVCQNALSAFHWFDTGSSSPVIVINFQAPWSPWSPLALVASCVHGRQLSTSRRLPRTRASRGPQHVHESSSIGFKIKILLQDRSIQLLTPVNATNTRVSKIREFISPSQLACLNHWNRQKVSMSRFPRWPQSFTDITCPRSGKVRGASNRAPTQPTSKIKL